MRTTVSTESVACSDVWRTVVSCRTPGLHNESVSQAIPKSITEFEMFRPVPYTHSLHDVLLEYLSPPLLFPSPHSLSVSFGLEGIDTCFVVVVVVVVVVGVCVCVCVCV